MKIYFKDNVSKRIKILAQKNQWSEFKEGQTEGFVIQLKTLGFRSRILANQVGVLFTSIF